MYCVDFVLVEDEIENGDMVVGSEETTDERFPYLGQLTTRDKSLSLPD